MLNKSIEVKRKILSELPVRHEKIDILFKVSPQLINIIDPEEAIDFLMKIAHDLFPQADTIAFFSRHKDANTLSLLRFSCLREALLKEQDGDILDKWVLKYNTSLLVENVLNDYRFDSNKTIAFKERSACSFIVSPLSIGEKNIGIMRVESKQPGCFNLEDLRILRGICDLGAVVLERASLFKQVEELAIKDALTALYVRNYFLQRLQEEMDRAALKKNKIGILMLDIDDFKNINDCYGHVVGDLVLKALAKKIKECIGKGGNLAARFGGEEFIIFFVEGVDKKAFLAIAEMVRRQVETVKVTFRDKVISCTVSIGVAVYPDDGNNCQSLLDKVDQRLYQAKRAGKNRVC